MLTISDLKYSYVFKILIFEIKYLVKKWSKRERSSWRHNFYKYFVHYLIVSIFCFFANIMQICGLNFGWRRVKWIWCKLIAAITFVVPHITYVSSVRSARHCMHNSYVLLRSPGWITGKNKALGLFCRKWECYEGGVYVNY